LKLGQCFFTPQSEAVDRHLWIVVSDPARDLRVAVVNLSTVPGPDGALEADVCVSAKEHPAIGRASFIRCEGAKVWQAADLDDLLLKTTLSPTKPAPAALLAKAQRALAASRHTPTEVKALLKAQGSTQSA
jgi:hypothetical protein